MSFYSFFFFRSNYIKIQTSVAGLHGILSKFLNWHFVMLS